LKKYQTYKIKYFKFLELAQLIKEEVALLEQKIPKNCEEILSKVKRFLVIIENNEKNGSSTASRALTGSRGSKSRMKSVEKQREE
jgi:hypothetical protein